MTRLTPWIDRLVGLFVVEEWPDDVDAIKAEIEREYQRVCDERDMWMARAASMFQYVPGEVKAGDLRAAANRIEKVLKGEP